MLRLAALAALVACSSFVGVAGQTVAGSVQSPNTPSDYTSSTQSKCILAAGGLSFTGGLVLLGQFQPNVFHYNANCKALTGPVTVKPKTNEATSSAEISWKYGSSQVYELNFRTNDPPNGISNGGSNGVAPNSPATESVPITLVQGVLNTITIGVGCNHLADPYCYYQYVITCTPPAAPVIVGDPQFVGLRGQSYQVHGVSGEIYNIVSDADLQYNSKFVFLDQGSCPVINGKKQKDCFSHPGSYLGELGLKTRAGDRIYLKSGKAAQGIAEITINGTPMHVGETVLLEDEMGSVTLNNTHTASVLIGNWDFVFENSDMYFNQQVKVLDSRGLASHGLLGQTWSEKLHPNPIKHIEGNVDDYVVKSQPKDIFGDDFLFNRFNQ